MDLNDLRNISIQFCQNNNNNYLSFNINGANLKFVNELRRTIISKISTLAIDRIMIITNTSSINDESLSHRLAFIPLAINPENYSICDPMAQENFSFTPDNAVQFSLKVKRLLGNHGSEYQRIDKDTIILDDSGLVYSKHLKFYQVDNNIEDDSLRPIDEEIMITKLLPGQELHIIGYAVRNFPSLHYKWSPVSMVHFYKITRDGDGNMTENKIKNRLDLIEGNHKCLNCSFGTNLDKQLCFCQQISNQITSNDMEVDSTSLLLLNWSYHFVVESIGQIPTYLIVKQALELIIKLNLE